MERTQAGDDVALASRCLEACGRLPLDSGALNVRAYGAKGDGRTDDTRAILSALAETEVGSDRERVVYFPAGTYLVTETLVKLDKEGHFLNGMLIHGEDQRTTTIQLKDHARGFDDPKSPKAIIYTTSKLYNQGTPTSGGKDWIGKGEGNEAFRNFVTDITIDVGRGNAGAVGIDYLGNNIGAIRNVTVTAPAKSGHAGISMTRLWPGPALLSGVRILGFDEAVHVAQTEYSIVMENLSIVGQQHAGVVNDGNVITMRNFRSHNLVPALLNTNVYGLVTILDGHFEGGRGSADAIENAGAIAAYNLSSTGYQEIIRTQPGVTSIASYAERPPGAPVSLSPQLLEAVEPPPQDFFEPVSAWVNVRRFGARGDGHTDDTAALKRAMRSGAHTIYFPFGEYVISEPVTPGPEVRRIVGMMSTLVDTRPLAGQQPIFQVALEAASLTIEALRLRSDDQSNAANAGLTFSSRGDLVLRDIQFDGVIKREAGGGKMFLEDVCCGLLRFAGSAPVWARQLNTEGSGTRIENRGAPVWILGLKTENGNTAIASFEGSRTEVLGGLFYPLTPVPPSVPAFYAENSHLAATMAESAYDPKATYSTLVIGRTGHSDSKISMQSQPSRGFGHIILDLEFPPP